jgi:hypothetical protein
LPLKGKTGFYLAFLSCLLSLALLCLFALLASSPSVVTEGEEATPSILPSISAQLLVCPKRAKLPSYLAFYLLLIITLSISPFLSHPFYLTEGEIEGEIEGEEASKR